MNLDKTWEECLRMWKWIVENLDDTNCVEELKVQWLDKNGYDDLRHECFFCEVAGRCGYGSTNCNKCPARDVDPDFNCCFTEYDYELYPKAFYAKLVELDKIRTK